MYKYSETVEFSWNIKPNRISLIVPDPAYFDVILIILKSFKFIKYIILNHSNVTKQISNRLNPTQNNIEILKKVVIGLVWFDLRGKF